MEAHDEWALMSNYNDRSFMRMPLALWLGRQMAGLDYAADMKFVEVYIVNDKWERIDYRGLFCLSEKANTRGNGRVDLKKLTASVADQSDPRVSGGYLIECVPNDKMKNQAEFNTKFRIPGWEDDNWHHYVFQYPNAKNITDAQREYMIQYMTDVYDNLYSDNFTDTINGYVKYIDENSFIDWCILHDLSKGTDNLFHASVFLQKDRNEKLRMTSPWDFDISFGNIEKENRCYFEDRFWIKDTKYFSRLWEDPRFREKLKKRYDDLMPLFDLVPYVLQENYKFLEESGALNREFNRFGENCLANFRYVNDIKTYKGHIRYLTEWFESRKAWLYYNLAETPEERCERMQQVRPVMRVMQPENLLNCTETHTRFMRSGDDEAPYSYRLVKGPDVSQTEYPNDWYNIKRSDGEYYIYVKEGDCTSIPSLPVEFCKERIYDEIIYTAPDGELLTQPLCNQMSSLKNLIILCGHYKGIDERIREHYITKEISVGNYVLTGGELAAAVIADSIARLIPGVLNDETSALSDSFQDDLVSPPIYTRPFDYNGWKVPEVLISGNEKQIKEWKLEQALQRTKERRPELL